MRGMRWIIALLVGLSIGWLGCDRRGSPTPQKRAITLYTSVDEPYVRPLIERFTQQTGVRVELVTDTEQTKSIGLAERLRAEKNNPRCDVWWGNEVFHTVRLAEEGMFAPYASPAAKDVREQYRDKDNRWTSVALRARVIAVAPELKDKIKGLQDLADPQYKGRVCLGRVAVGTIGGHVSSLYVLWGNERADAFFKQLAANDAKMVGGNSDVTRQIAAGNFVLGLTDNDDVTATLAAGGKIDFVLPDQNDLGTLAMPTTVALVNRPDIHDDARRLIDFLLSPEVEAELIAAQYAGWSVRSADTEFRAMKVDYAEVARTMPEAVHRTTAILEGR